MAIYIAQMKPLTSKEKFSKSKLIHVPLAELREFVEQAYRVWAIIGVDTPSQAKSEIIVGQRIKLRGGNTKFIDTAPTWECGELYRGKISKQDKKEGGER